LLQACAGPTPDVSCGVLRCHAQVMAGPGLFEQGAGMLNVEGAVRLARSLSPYAYALPVGQTLASSGLPTPQSTIAGETVAWSQGLIWGLGMLRGDAIFTSQQSAYAQSLIWGVDGAGLIWGAAVTYYHGLHSQGYVAFGKTDQ